MVVYLPILTLTGVEGKMFVPMAVTVLMALFGAMVLSMTFVPASVVIFLSGRVSEKENVLMAWANKAYIPSLDLAGRNSGVEATAAVVLVLLSALLASRMGSEVIPRLDEGDVALHALR